MTFASSPTLQMPLPAFQKFFVTIQSQKPAKQIEQLRIHSSILAPHIKTNYTASDIAQLRSLLAKSTKIRVNDRGLVQAADRPGAEESDPTNYNAVWVRDSMWAYLSLNSAPATQADAKRVLYTMIDYMSSPDQLARFQKVTAKPSLLKGPNGNMEAVHIRFDARSPTYQDVQVGGKPQPWNHKQNDALGLLFDLSLRAIESGQIPLSGLKDAHWKALASFPAYFSAIAFYDMEDAGPWEEIDRTNSSSIGLVTSGLEQLNHMLTTQPQFAQKIKEVAKELKVDADLEPAALKSLIDKGYERIFKQLAAGGESPLYPVKDNRFRKADAALLNLIYPARLSRFKVEHRERVLECVRPLIGPIGIKRYLQDSYQSGNFWFRDLDFGAEIDSHTDDTSSLKEFVERGSRFIPDTEAEWFFDSWYSVIMGQMYRETGKNGYRKAQIESLNRALGQVTGGTPQKPVLGADGKPVPALALPESYNTVVKGDHRVYVPSPITPLNWAKASLLLAFREWEQGAVRLIKNVEAESRR